jgi:hypothetical protein
MNHDVWGVHLLRVDPFRFVNNAKLQTSKSYRPFGGGHTLCPGRFLAKRSMGFAVALLLSRYDISMVPERMRNGGKRIHKDLPAFPRINSTKPTPEASLPHEGEDVALFLKERL